MYGEPRATAYAGAMTTTSFTLADSALLREAMTARGVHVTRYEGAGEYPKHRAEKDEAEAFVGALDSQLDTVGLRALKREMADYLSAMFPPDVLAEAEKADEQRRLVCFAALQCALDDACYELAVRAYDPPSRVDPVFRACPALFDRLTKDGLLPITRSDLDDGPIWGEGGLVHGDLAVFVHPALARLRELVDFAFGLTERPGLTVAVALDPYRVVPVKDVSMRLLHDYWDGPRLTAENLDSLDPHDVGVRSFHGASQDTPERFWFPLLGTWFDWERRSRHDATDPVKRLYIREVTPATNNRGEPTDVAVNRELHAERDTQASRFLHVDGKTCRYNADDYEPSFSRPRADPGTPQASRKLWRVDGPITDDEFSVLVHAHFRQNELIGEHFADVFPDPDFSNTL